MEDQRRPRLLGAADDVRGRRQAVCGDPDRAQPGVEDAARLHPGTARDAPPDHDVRVRAVMAHRNQREVTMHSQSQRCLRQLLPAVALIAAAPALASDVTPDRLVNADKEPQNWLMNHRTYDAQRFSPLARINRDTVTDLNFAYAVP